MYVIKSCDLSVLSLAMSLHDGFPKKKNLDRGVGGWVELYPHFFGIFLTFSKPLFAADV